jgi:hypothetical protein
MSDRRVRVIRTFFVVRFCDERWSRQDQAPALVAGHLYTIIQC